MTSHSYIPSQRAFLVSIFTLLTVFHAGPVSAQGRVIRVTTTQARTAPVEETDQAVGVIESRVSAQVAAEVSGKVVSILADEGQAVEAGQVLAEIETRQYRYNQEADQAEVGRLTALLKNKQLELDRAHKLVAERLIAAEQVDAIEAELEALKQQLEGARAKVAESDRRLGKTRVTAPVKAEIADRKIDVGDFVQAGTVCFEVVDVQHLRVRLPFPEYRAPALKVGQTVRLNSAAAGSTMVENKVTEVRPSVNPANRSISVIVDFDNPGGWRPGASVRAELVLSVRPNAVMVPQVSVVHRPAGDVVYVIGNGKAQERAVTRGLRSGASIEIREGLAGGETVAVDGAGFLTQGASVEVVEKK